ncbi:polysaccharide biosynthesis protein [Taibaiella sp. KBW10]|nr:polysaccharide biosynthesis protein [Taibaiella sp. KBW10]
MSSVAARLLNSLLIPILSYLLSSSQGMIDLGGVSLIYAYFAVLNVIFTYGMETAYFRFCAADKENRKQIFNTAFGSLLISTIIFCILLYLLRVPIEQFVELGGHTEYITLAAIILFFDTLQTIPFALLRQENKPRKYAFIKVFGIVLNILAVIFFIVLVPKLAQQDPNGFFADLGRQFNVVSFVLLANLLQSVFVFLMLFQEWRQFSIRFDTALWQKMFRYSSPMIIIGLAGMVNEVIDRQMLVKLIDGSKDYAMKIQAIYSQNYKLSIVITLFVTAFRMAAEPFFFSKSQDKNAPELYAKVMKWFVITVCLAFLTTALFIDDVWKYYMGPSYRSGLYIVPVLLIANVFSGIYYNLSIWYKITDKMRIGIYITVFGAIITFVGNYLFIPKFEMLAAAWTTLVCYFSMVIVCYIWGQKYYPIPYPMKRILTYLIAIVLLFLIHKGIIGYLLPHANVYMRLGSGILWFVCFLLLILKLERKELASMPLIGKFLK